MGEHSDWAGSYRRFNKDIEPGMCLVSGTNQGFQQGTGCDREREMVQIRSFPTREGTHLMQLLQRRLYRHQLLLQQRFQQSFLSILLLLHLPLLREF